MSLSFLFLAALFLAVLVVDSASMALPRRELRRRARSDGVETPAAHRLLKFTDTGWAGKVLLWLIGTVSGAIIMVWLIKTSYWLTAIGVILLSWLLLNRRQLVNSGNWLWRPAAAASAAAAWLLDFIEPVTAKLPPLKEPATGRLYEPEDLIDLIRQQSRQTENRIEKADLTAAAAAIGFSKLAVADIVKPIKEVRIVLPDEAIGPHLMDELHETGYSTFPLGQKPGKGQPPQIEGIVYIKDLVANPNKQTAKQVANRTVSYIRPAASLRLALQQCLTDNASLLVVCEEHDEPQGIVWLEDILEKLLGRKLSLEQDNPADADEHQKVLE